MTAAEWIGKNMNYHVIKKFMLQWLVPTESNPEFPWQDGDEALGPLAFGPGLFWADGVKKTPAYNWMPYEDGTGIPDGADGDPAIFRLSRHKFYGAVTAGPSMAFDHEFNTWPLVQIIERGGGASGVPWTAFDLFGAGGSIVFDINLDQITIDFGGAFDGIVVVVG